MFGASLIVALLLSQVENIHMTSHGQTTYAAVNLGQKESKIAQQTNGNPETPNIDRQNFGYSVNHTEAIIKVDKKYGDIYVLTLFKNNFGSTMNSTLYIVNASGVLFQDLGRAPNKDYAFTNIYTGGGTAIFVSNIVGVIAASFDRGKSWEYKKETFRRQYINVVISGRHDNSVAMLTDYESLFFLEKPELTLDFQAWRAKNVVWYEEGGYFYYQSVSYQETFPGLYRTKPGMILGEMVERNVEKFGISGKFLWAVQKTEKERKLILMHDNNNIEATIFPFYLKPLDFKLCHITSNDVVVLVLNDTKETYLYMASLADMKFSRVGDRLGVEQNDTLQSSYELQFFDRIPGLILSNKGNIVLGPEKMFTVISFNYGERWTHVLGPREIQGKICRWPECYVRLTFAPGTETDDKAIKTDPNNPLLVVGYGSLYMNNVEIYKGVLMSIDGGFIWNTVPTNIRKIEILNAGAILVGIPELVQTIFYSLDMGTTWQSVKIIDDSSVIRSVVTYPTTESLRLHLILFDYEKSTWSFLSIDFSPLISITCTPQDYEQFTPGVHKKFQCFRGTKGSFKQRKSERKCKITYNNLRVSKPAPCPCTEDDFGCTFGHYFSENDRKCYDDPDNAIEMNVDICRTGDFQLKPSKTKVLEGDVCSETEGLTDQDADICEFTSNDQTISILVGSTIKYINRRNNHKKSFSVVPIRTFSAGYIKFYGINLLTRCLYVLNETGLVRYCYGKRKLAFEHKEEMFLNDASIIGFRIDEFTNTIFYYNRTTVIAIHGESRYRKTIYHDIQTNLTYMNIAPESGLIFVSFAKKRENQWYYVVNALHMNGMIRHSFSFEQKVTAITTVYESRNIVVVTENGDAHIFSPTFFSLKTVKDQPSNVYEAYYDDDRFYYILASGIYYEQLFHYQNHITQGFFHFNNGKNITHACSIAHCDFLCLALSPYEYECVCPKNMDFDHKMSKCVCIAGAHDCSECQESEFHCSNHKCVPDNKRCNGVNDCGDHSDEKDCEIVCELDEFLCRNETKCLGFSKICDGKADCIDGSDELHCHEVHTCNKDQYRCINSKCIQKRQVCDEKNDCGDFSDEDSCEQTCKYFEHRCDNGQCIMQNQVCDYNFDCSDLSDERGCHTNIKKKANASCLVFCDGKCIPKQHVCDHITECKNGIDEIHCGSKANCQVPYNYVCESDFLCYSVQQLCDGVKDCLDASDEASCQDKSVDCNGDNVLECASKDRCIDINMGCDGKYDCPDKSDESQFCLNEMQIRGVKMGKMVDGFLEISWTINKISSKNKLYNLTLIHSDRSSSLVFNKKHSSTSLKLSDLETCRRYTLIIKPYGHVQGRFFQFTYKNSLLMAPTTLNYEFSKNLITWNYTISTCVPTIFYLQCIKDDEIVYQNFSLQIYYILNYVYGLSCRVATCPMNVFNISCSPFTTPIYLIYYSPYYKAMIISCWLLIFFLVFTIIIVFLVRLKIISLQPLVSYYKNRNVPKMNTTFHKLYDKADLPEDETVGF